MVIYFWNRNEGEVRIKMKALVLAGGFPQIALIDELKSRGITVVLADYFPNPIAKSTADIFYQKSTLDLNGIRDIATKESVDLIITVCTDQALLTVAKVSEELNLPCYIDSTTANKVTNKMYMKQIFKLNQIPTANFNIVKNICEHKEILYNLKFPLVVKPVDCNSSKGVKKVKDVNALTLALDDAINYSRTKTAIVEEYIYGCELTVDAVVRKGKAVLLSISQNQKIQSEDRFVIFRYDYPANISHIVAKKILDCVQRIVDVFQLSDCPMLIQFICRDEEIFVIEFSARTGGGLKYKLINEATGVDIIKETVDMTLGYDNHINVQNTNLRIRNEFIYCSSGIFSHFEGSEELVSSGVLQGFYPFKNQGEKFEKVESSGDRIAGFTIIGKTMYEVIKKHNIVVEKIKVIDINGNDIMRHDLLIAE